MTASKLMTLLAASALAACGGTTTPITPTLAPQTGNTGTNNAVLDSSGTNFVVTSNGMTHTLAPNPALDLGTFRAFRDVAIDSGAMVSSSANSNAELAYINPFTNGVMAATYERTAGTPLPMTGKAIMTGDYTGMIVSQTGNFQTRITGDVGIDVDFSANSMSGGISNRVTRGLFNNMVGSPVDPVTFAPTSITNAGTFAGAATGGALIGGLNSVDSGDYEGLFAGTAGAEIVGALTINHRNVLVTSTERGVFALGH